MKKFITVIIVILMASVAFAAPRDGANRAYPWGMRSVAALGMGDAYYTKSDSKYAPFYNPAGLARVKTSRVDILPLMGAANKKAFSFVGDVMDVDYDNTTEVGNMLKDYIGEPINGQFHLYPGYTRPNLTIGGYINASVDASASNPVLPELNMAAEVEIGVVLGMAGAALNDRLQFGAAGRFFYKVNELSSYTFLELSENEFDISWDTLDKGYNLMLDLGVIYNIFNDGINPRIGLAVNNIGLVETGDADNAPATLNLSAGISPSFNGINTDIIFDIRDVTQAYDQDDDWGKRINIGAEIRLLRDIIALRAGLHQGYFAGGVGLNFRVITLDYAYYKEEIGAYSGQKSDTRHALELVIGF